ncbi:hypothetical protein AB0M87_33270, partial [Streptomyces sp. NPDC051320]
MAEAATSTHQQVGSQQTATPKVRSWARRTMTLSCLAVFMTQMVTTIYLPSLSLLRFDGHSRSGVQPREDVHHGEHGEEEASP